MRPSPAYADQNDDGERNSDRFVQIVEGGTRWRTFRNADHIPAQPDHDEHAERGVRERPRQSRPANRVRASLSTPIAIAHPPSSAVACAGS